jgi:hypothetical protein
MYQTRDVGDIKTTGINILAYIGSEADFTVLAGKSDIKETHKIKITALDLSSGIITIQVDSVPQILELKESAEVDLDGDQIPDISIKFVNIYKNRAELTVKSLLDKTEIETPVTNAAGITPMNLSWRHGLNSAQKAGITDLLNRMQNDYILSSVDKANLNYALGTSWQQSGSLTSKIITSKSTYLGNSIEDYLISIGHNSSYANRARLAASYGIIGYSGTAAQNFQLLRLLK